MHHYSETELERYRMGKMNLFSLCLCRIHLWNCADCRALLEKLEEDDLLIADLKLSLSKNQTDENPETYKKLRDHFHAEAGSSL